MQYLFTLGHQPHISTAELQAVFSTLDLSYTARAVSKKELLVETTTLDLKKIMECLGGTVMIRERLSLPDKGDIQKKLYITFKTPNLREKFNFLLLRRATVYPLKRHLKRREEACVMSRQKIPQPFFIII